jgi:hypothetical protein
MIAYRSFLAGNQRALIQSRLVYRVANSPKCIQPPLTALALLEKVPNGLLDQIVRALIMAAREFLLDLHSQIRWQCDMHAISLFHFTHIPNRPTGR